MSVECRGQVLESCSFVSFKKKWIKNSIAHICFLFLHEWSVGLLASLVLVNNATVNTSCIYQFVIRELELQAAVSSLTWIGN